MAAPPRRTPPRQASYTRFEIYVPVIFTHNDRRYELDFALIQQFSTETTRKYGGITQANPMVVPYRGWWLPAADQPASIDHLTYLFGLVRIDQTDEAIAHFNDWKRRFERRLRQDIILITFHPVNVLGGFL